MTPAQPARRFVVRATCTIKGSSLENTVVNMWHGATRAAANKAQTRLTAQHSMYYRDWEIVDSQAAKA